MVGEVQDGCWQGAGELGIKGQITSQVPCVSVSALWAPCSAGSPAAGAQGSVECPGSPCCQSVSFPAGNLTPWEQAFSTCRVFWFPQALCAAGLKPGSAALLAAGASRAPF